MLILRKYKDDAKRLETDQPRCGTPLNRTNHRSANWIVAFIGIVFCKPLQLAMFDVIGIEVAYDLAYGCFRWDILSNLLL